MKNKLKQYPKIFNFLKFIKSPHIPFNTINVMKKFPLYAPASAGSYGVISKLTIQSVNETVPALLRLTSLNSKNLELKKVGDVFDLSGLEENISLLQECFLKYSCFKGANINQVHLYAHIMKNRNSFTSVIEIGLGTNYSDTPSHMPSNNAPGSSQRGFRDFLPNAHIIGCDIDKRVLFNESRVSSFYLDQTNYSTFEALNLKIPNEIDLLIDDGLHVPNANILSLFYGLQKIKIGGWVVIEDIGPNSIELWKIINQLIPMNFRGYLLDQGGGAMYAVQRIQ
jgi:hypothetical protein